MESLLHFTLMIKLMSRDSRTGMQKMSKRSHTYFRRWHPLRTAMGHHAVSVGGSWVKAFRESKLPERWGYEGPGMGAACCVLPSLGNLTVQIKWKLASEDTVRSQQGRQLILRKGIFWERWSQPCSHSMESRKPFWWGTGCHTVQASQIFCVCCRVQIEH